MADIEKEFNEFLEGLNIQLDEKDQELIRIENLRLLFEYYDDVQRFGGIVKVISEQILIPKELPLDLKEFFFKYFLSFEYYKKKGNRSLLDLSYLEYSFRLSYIDFMEQGNTNIIKEQQILCISMSKEQLEEINLNSFDLKSLQKNHGNQLVDIREQKCNPDSFQPQDQQQYQIKLSIDDYIHYQQDQESMNSILCRRGYTPLYQKILFAVNVDMDEWQYESNILRGILPEFSFGTESDGLSYLRQHILGVSVPQIYLKVAEVYTGGHQEHISLTAVNLNHGPGSSVWITVDSHHVTQLRDLVMKENGVDILQKEGLWFKDVDYFIQNKIPVKYTLQKAGDMIVLGPGCLHLVKSEGVTVQSAWNFMVKEYKFCRQMYHRYLINKQIGYQTVVPIKNLFMDIFNHERKILSPKTSQFIKNVITISNMKQKLIEFREEERQSIRKLIEKMGRYIKYVEYRSDSNQVVLIIQQNKKVISCSNCWHEIFIYFYMIDGHRQGGDKDFFCVSCMEQEILKSEVGSAVISEKYKSMVLADLLTNTLYDKCYSSLCFPHYVGSINCNGSKQKTMSSTYIHDPIIEVNETRDSPPQPDTQIIGFKINSNTYNAGPLNSDALALNFNQKTRGRPRTKQNNMDGNNNKKAKQIKQEEYTNVITYLQKYQIEKRLRTYTEQKMKENQSKDKSEEKQQSRKIQQQPQDISEFLTNQENIQIPIKKKVKRDEEWTS